VLDNLADAAQGNEVQVRFDLDLNGILKVAAVERATGRSKALVIDNAMERLRLAHAAPFSQAADIGLLLNPHLAEVQPLAESPPDESPELREARQRAAALADKARVLSATANAADAADLDRTVAAIEDALSERSLPRLRQLTAELEDLVFYLHDA
jgi:molecular chaperone DnaK (HSP70)